MVVCIKIIHTSYKNEIDLHRCPVCSGENIYYLQIPFPFSWNSESRIANIVSPCHIEFIISATYDFDYYIIQKQISFIY